MTVNIPPRLPSGSQSSPRPPRPLARPTLLPGLRRLWRGRHRLQLGVDPACAAVLDLPDPRAARLLDLLDGSRSERVVLAEAVRLCRIGPEDARQLLDALCAAGLVVGAHSLLPRDLPEPVRRRLAGEAATLALRGSVGGRSGWPTAGSPTARSAQTPAQILRRRAAARVAVAGYGRLAAQVGVALAQAGVGHVAPAAAPELAEAIARAAPGTKTSPLRHREATFAVQIGAAGPAVLTATGYAQRRLAHLAVSVRDGAVTVGPLVPPGGSPCLNCLDLHRKDRDPDWPLLAAQLAVPDFEPCAATTALFAAGFAAAEVLAWLDGVGRPATLGASIDISSPSRQRRRSWSPHPGCPCIRRTGRRAPARAQ